MACCLPASLYGVDAAQGQGKTKQAVTAFLKQRFSPADQHEFYKFFLNSSVYHDATSRPIELKGDDGGKWPFGGTESMLDAEYMTALGLNISTEFWGFKVRHAWPCLAWSRR